MDGDGTFRRLTDVQEAADDDVARRAAVHEEQVVVREAGVRKAGSLVHLPVEPDHVADVVLSEVGEVRLGGVEKEPWNHVTKYHDHKYKPTNAFSCQPGRETQVNTRSLTFSLTILDFALGVRPTEGQQLPWNNPVKVTVFYTLHKEKKKGKKGNKP